MEKNPYISEIEQFLDWMVTPAIGDSEDFWVGDFQNRIVIAKDGQVLLTVHNVDECYAASAEPRTFKVDDNGRIIQIKQFRAWVKKTIFKMVAR